MKTEIIKAVLAFRRGELSISAFVAILFQHLDASTLPIFLPLCPPDLMKALKVVVLNSPTTDAEWTKLRFVEGRVGNQLTPEEAEKAVAILRARYRKGVETLRQYFAGK